MSLATVLEMEVAHGRPASAASECSAVTVASGSRVAAWQQLCRPRIAVMSAVAAAVGFTLASPGGIVWGTFTFSVVGIICFVNASSTLNQVWERRTDALMERTRRRPLVQNVVSAAEATTFGLGCAVAGLLSLACFVNITTAVVAMATMLIYVLAYTPLKTRSGLCTTVGAVPGAMPAVLGWLAAGGSMGVEAWTLFAIFFVWQFPHFLAIGWIYRDQYQRAGLKMLPSFSDHGLRTGFVALTYAAVFIPVSCLPRFVGLAGNGYLAAALILSVGYFVLSVRFSWLRSDRSARQLMAGSLICLPVLLLSLFFDFLRLTS